MCIRVDSQVINNLVTALPSNRDRRDESMFITVIVTSHSEAKGWHWDHGRQTTHYWLGIIKFVISTGTLFFKCLNRLFSKRQRLTLLYHTVCTCIGSSYYNLFFLFLEQYCTNIVTCSFRWHFKIHLMRRVQDFHFKERTYFQFNWMECTDSIKSIKISLWHFFLLQDMCSCLF